MGGRVDIFFFFLFSSFLFFSFLFFSFLFFSFLFFSFFSFLFFSFFFLRGGIDISLHSFKRTRINKELGFIFSLFSWKQSWPFQGPALIASPFPSWHQLRLGQGCSWSGPFLSGWLLLAEGRLEQQFGQLVSKENRVFITWRSKGKKRERKETFSFFGCSGGEFDFVFKVHQGRVRCTNRNSK